MSTTQTTTTTLERNNETGLSDSTHSSSSSSAEKFRLDEFDDAPILLYKYRGGFWTSSQKDLCSMLDKDDNLRLTRKQIPRMTSYLDVKRHDLYLPDEKEAYASLPNYDSNLACIKVPSLAYWSRMFLGNYQELYIVSPESSPGSSVADSESKRTSPTHTWSREESEGAAGDGDARLGAEAENDGQR